MKSAQSQFVWQGRLQLGDEPGIYGDAAYIGLTAEFPMTIKAFPPIGQQGKQKSGSTVAIILKAEGVAVYAGYPGHQLRVLGYVQSSPGKWTATPIPVGKGEESWTGDSGEHTLNLQALAEGLSFISVSLRVDTTVQPGLYDDFVITGISIVSKTHYAMFGFRD